MSALQEILDKMYVDPEILNQLTDEQKQILFIKMRDEQLRKWRIFEDEMERLEMSSSPKINMAKCEREERVKWLFGGDGEVWVWVMGEHPNDLTIEEILENEAKERARSLAEEELMLNNCDTTITALKSNECRLQGQKYALNDQQHQTSNNNGCSLIPAPVETSASDENTSLPDGSSIVSASDDNNSATGVGNQVLPPLSQRKDTTSISPSPADRAIRPKTNPAVTQNSNTNRPWNWFYPTSRSSDHSHVPVNAPKAKANTDSSSETTSTPSPTIDQPFKRAGNVRNSPAYTFFNNRISTGGNGNDVTEKLQTISTPTRRSTPVNVPIRFVPTRSERSDSNLKRDTDSDIYDNLYNNSRWQQSSRPKSRPSDAADQVIAAASASSFTIFPANKNTNGSSTQPEHQPQQTNDIYSNLPQNSTSYADEGPKVFLRPNRRPPALPPKPPKDSSSQADPGEIEKRQSRIFEELQAQRKKLDQEAETEAEQQRFAWEEQQQKSKAADETIRRMAQKAREAHERNLRTSNNISLPSSSPSHFPSTKHRNINEHNGSDLTNSSKQQERTERNSQMHNNNQERAVERLDDAPVAEPRQSPVKQQRFVSLRDALRKLQRPPKPPNRAAIIDWFQDSELPSFKYMGILRYVPHSMQKHHFPDNSLARPAGIAKVTAEWFHGIITRERAEELLKLKPRHSFLIRVSERIYGYTVSCVTGTNGGEFKHFIVERCDDGYQFLGLNQIVHSNLEALVHFHKSQPITRAGGELLHFSVGQRSSYSDLADYAELFIDS